MPRLNFADYPSLTFEKPDIQTFRCLNIAYQASRAGGDRPCVMNAANEVAVSLFLNDRIGFMDIPRIIEQQLEEVPYSRLPFVIGEVCLFGKTHIRAVFEEVDKGNTSLHIERATFIGSIAHIHCHPAIAHQSGDGIHLRGIAGIRQRIRHIRVVIVGTAVIDRQRAVVAP